MPIQVRFQSDADKAAEHKRSTSNVAMLNTELARPIGVVKGTSVGGTRRPRTSGASSECITHKLNEDGTYTSTIFRPATTTRTSTSTRRKSTSRAEMELFRAEMQERAQSHRVTAADLPAVMAD